MSPLNISFPGHKSRRDRQNQRSTMDNMVAENPSLQGERTRGRQSTRHGNSSIAPAGSSHQHNSKSPLLRPRGGRVGMALDGQGYRTYSPQPTGLRRRTGEYTTRGGGGNPGEASSSSRSRPQHSPPSKHYAPRSTTSGHLSFESPHQTDSRQSTISTLNLGPPALPSRPRHPSPNSTNFYPPSSKSHPSSIHVNKKIRPSHDSSFTSTRSSSATRNALVRVHQQRSFGIPRQQQQTEQRESPREALRRSQRNSRIPEFARGPERAVEVESVRQRGIERFFNAEDGAEGRGGRSLGGGQRERGEAEKDGAGRGEGRGEGRIEQQGFRKWYWGR